MAVKGLIDTGAILGYLDPRDPWHATCVTAMRRLPLPLLTSTAVLTEVFHFVRRRSLDQGNAWSFVRSELIALAPIEPEDLPEIHFLMSRYADCPMDFADATLVLLARRHKLTTIFTTDHNDFETYRIEGKRKFRIVPGRRA